MTYFRLELLADHGPEYVAERNGEKYPLTVDKDLAFYAIIDGVKKGAYRISSTRNMRL